MAIDLFRVFISPDAKEAVGKVLDSGYIGEGPVTKEFEAALRRHLGTDNLALVNSCTSALTLAVHMLRTEGGWDDDAEILCTPMTCFATVAAILANRVRVKWVDVDYGLNVDLVDLKRKLSAKTKAVMLVHWGGNPVDLDQLAEIQRSYRVEFGSNLPVIEDAAHAWMSRYNGEFIGGRNPSNWVAFSWQAIKSLTTGDGGMLVAPDGDSAKRARLLRWFGLDRDAGQSFRCVQNIPEWGWKFQTTDIASAIGLANMPRVPVLIKRHQENAAFYDQHLAHVAGVSLIPSNPLGESSCWLYTIHVRNRAGFVRMMTENGIAVSPVHARCDRHDCVKEFRSFLPNMDVFGESMVCIPVGFWVGDDDRRKIVETMNGGW